MLCLIPVKTGGTDNGLHIFLFRLCQRSDVGPLSKQDPSLSGLLGPALGGIVYQIWGILPVLYVCTVCFTVSAVMEIFITIPFQKQKRRERIIQIGRAHV